MGSRGKVGRGTRTQVSQVSRYRSAENKQYKRDDRKRLAGCSKKGEVMLSGWQGGKTSGKEEGREGRRCRKSLIYTERKKHLRPLNTTREAR